MVMVTQGMNVRVLLSGGLDSAACTSFFVNQDADVIGLFVDYGQPSRKEERRAADAVARHYGITVHHATWKGLNSPSSGEIVGRNALLFAGALLEVGQGPVMLAAGIHAGTGYFDCTDAFVQAWQGLLDGYTQGRVQLALPFLSWSKRDVWAFCSQHDVPTELTYSCERGGIPPCGDCRSCKDREMLDAL